MVSSGRGAVIGSACRCAILQPSPSCRIERAVEPLRDRLSDEQRGRLVSSLCIVLGWEAMIVLQDIRGHARQREREVNSWAAQGLVRAMLDEADI